MGIQASQVREPRKYDLLVQLSDGISATLAVNEIAKPELSELPIAKALVALNQVYGVWADPAGHMDKLLVSVPQRNSLINFVAKTLGQVAAVKQVTRLEA